jgi:hypothetical protein
MVTEVIKELKAAKAKVEALEQSLLKERKQKLASLPAELGFDTVAAFIDAVREAVGGRRGRPPKSASGSSAGGRKGRRRRAKITAETKSSVKAAVNAGKTGAQIAKELGISVPSVQNIKKELGLVKARKK